ncbi:hypothetical protein GCK72_022531 [Caenorhabditis remanei]|uniref:C2H2-type domain-containing protein n=2 Tax=Caenorhabditis remanei TaxID=31234 RepID=E3N4I2_CAERE|nr:hypothetical protein GCK72_022531 [Caenorhabditis remanei]EFO85540.1 hypothetical protein CRE_29102 [Caenorhabditis remanei]EFO85549.1 hypothetical protein CRE_29097 [Caenorhabditis remanei]KAF1746079.1 hypothetical protein GCK72_022531 [Caenorhabditis remanei]
MPIKQEKARGPTQDGNSSSQPNGGGVTLPIPCSVRLTMMNPFGCVICSLSFSQVKDLHAHMSNAHKNAFRCNFCLEEFQQLHHLERHFNMTHIKDE